MADLINKFFISLILIVWLIITGIFVLSLIGLFFLVIDDEEYWLSFGHKLIDTLIQ